MSRRPFPDRREYSVTSVTPSTKICRRKRRRRRWHMELSLRASLSKAMRSKVARRTLNAGRPIFSSWDAVTTPLPPPKFGGALLTKSPKGPIAASWLSCSTRGGLEERGGVLAELGEGVEGASPADSSLMERDEHRTEQREDEDQGAEGKEEGVPGGEARGGAHGAVSAGAGGAGGRRWHGGGRVEERDDWGGAEEEQPRAAYQ